MTVTNYDSCDTFLSFLFPANIPIGKRLSRNVEVAKVVANDELWYRVDMGLEDDRASYTGLLPFLMPFVAVIYTNTAFRFKKFLELGNRDITKSDGIHA